jgi:uncharacterized protein
MNLSEDRLSHWAHLLTDSAWNADLVDYTDEDQALRAAKKVLQEYVKEEVDVDKKAREKVASLKRSVMEGTPEWDVLYRKYYEEERNKRGQK